MAARTRPAASPGSPVSGVSDFSACRGPFVRESRPTPGRERRKIGAIGIHVSRGITSHGFAFNVTTDLDFFRLINPCGITDRPVTSLAKEVSNPDLLPNLEEIAHQAARQFGLVFGEQVLGVESVDALRAQAASRAPAPLEQPVGEDTPLQVPREVELLHDSREHPVRGLTGSRPPQFIIRQEAWNELLPVRLRGEERFMPTDIIMPQMGESIFEGTITKWLKKAGDPVEKDEPLFEISTDKVDAEIPISCRRRAQRDQVP